MYHKAGVLYGLHQARQAVARERSVIVVEGYFDLLSLVSAGFENVVAPCGTALTRQQLGVLSRNAQVLYAVFDGDAAGFKAVERAAPDMLRSGMEVKVVFLPKGMDPDDMVREEGPSAFARLLDGAKPLVEALMDRMIQEAEPTIEGKAAVVKRLSPVISAVTDPVKRDLYLKRLASALDTSIDAVLSSVMDGRAAAARRARSARSEGLSRYEDLLIKLLTFHPDLAPRAVELGAERDPGIEKIIKTAE